MPQVNQAELRSEDWDGWNAWVDERISVALEQHKNFVTEVTGEALGEINAAFARIPERAGSRDREARR